MPMPPKMPSRIVDIHPHAISADRARYPREPLGGKASVWSEERPASAEQLMQYMDEAGVARAAIVQASTCYGYDNSYLADVVAQYPQRYTGVFSVDMLAADAPERIRYWHGRQLSGLRLFTAGSTMVGQADWLADPRSFPAWDEAAALGLPVCVQMRAAGMPQLRVLLARYPQVRIVIDHMMNTPMPSGPPYPEADPLFELAAHPNVTLKLTPMTVRNSRGGLATPETFFPRVLQAFGARRIAWGSNFPTNAGTLKALLEDSLDALAWAPADDLEWIFNKTACALYPALHPALGPALR
jgi:L-fuconolactonase